MTVSDEIRIGIRRAIGYDMITQSVLAERIKMKPSQLSAYLTGEREMQVDTLNRICEGLGRTLQEVLEHGK